MNPLITLRALRSLLLVFVALGATFGLAACGGDGQSSADIKAKIDAASAGEENVADGATASELAKAQVDANADEKAAAEAVKRRQELKQIEEEKKKSAEAVESGDVGDSNDATDLAEQKFRAQLAGVCEGAQSRITKVSKAASKAQKANDPQALLKVAKDYNDALNDFITALKNLDAPASQVKLYSSWLGTIDALANNIRLQLVSYADAKESAKLAKKTTELTTTFVTQTAELGVSCLSLS